MRYTYSAPIVNSGFSRDIIRWLLSRRTQKAETISHDYALFLAPMPPFELRFYRTGYINIPSAFICYNTDYSCTASLQTQRTTLILTHEWIKTLLLPGIIIDYIHTYVVRIYLKHADRERALPFHRSTARALTQQRGRVGRVLRVL